MSQDSADPDSLSQMLSEATGIPAEDIEERAATFEIEGPEEAEWEYIE